MKKRSGKVPKHLISIYGSARAFKALKRRQLTVARKALDELRTGCAFFPCGAEPALRARRALEEIEQSINVKAWGR